jgi:hypothetical protein
MMSYLWANAGATTVLVRSSATPVRILIVVPPIYKGHPENGNRSLAPTGAARGGPKATVTLPLHH